MAIIISDNSHYQTPVDRCDRDFFVCLINEHILARPFFPLFSMETPLCTSLNTDERWCDFVTISRENSVTCY